MASWETYKGNILLPDNPTGDAGINLKNDLKVLRDTLTLAFIHKNVSYTALPNDLVLCTTPSSSITVTLPNDPLIDTRVGIKYQTVTSNRLVTVRVLSGGGGHLIGRGDEGGELVLYVAGDYVELSYTGNNYWQVVSDTRQAHVAELVRNDAQTISNNSETECDFNSVSFDNANLASTSTDSITIKRAGKYQVSGNIGFDTITDKRDVELRLKVTDSGGTTIMRRSTLRLPTSEGLDDPYWQVDGILNLAVDDQVKLYVYQRGSSGSKDTKNNIAGRPRLTVAEIL